MDLNLRRTEFTDDSTIGELSIDGTFECYTLQDKVRPVKVKGLTAIPAGDYEVIVNYSARFKRQLPPLVNVPGFDGIRIHTGNTEGDTEGCILVGKTKGKNFIGLSKAAFNTLFDKMKTTSEHAKIFIRGE